MRTHPAVALVLLAGALAPACTAQTTRPTLRGAADDKLLIGAAIMSSSLDDPNLANFIAEQFNCLTGENEFKPMSLQPEPGKFSFEAADKIVAFAQQHNMKVVGHNLCWHAQTGRWMYTGSDGKPLPREQGLANLKNHIDTVVEHFKGKVIGWDVVNEAMSDRPGEYLRASPAQKAIGDDYIEKAFEFAHAADPDAQLYYNDYSDENPEKLEKVLRLVRSLKSKGLRIDGVGIQGHWRLQDPDPTATLEKAIAAYAAEGVKVMFTEVDLDVLPRRTRGAEVNQTERNAQDPYKKGLPDDIAQAQAKRYGQIMSTIMKHRDVVTRVTFWGIDDGHSWLNNWPAPGRTNHGLLFDRRLQPKPAFDAVVEALSGR